MVSTWGIGDCAQWTRLAAGACLASLMGDLEYYVLLTTSAFCDGKRRYGVLAHFTRCRHIFEADRTV